MFDPKLKEALGRVQKPGRYTGGEPGSVYKDKEKVDVRFAFCFPDTYEVGMSFLGEKILYELLNSHENWWCERAFMPWLDMKAEMERLDLPLYTMESKDPLTDFDAVGFTLQYELSYTNILAMLDLAHIPFYAKDRDEHWPLIVAGGPCACNSEPIADFFDVIQLGEGENQLPSICAEIERAKKEGGVSKKELLRRIAKIPGVYIPAFYDVTYFEDGRVKAITPNEPGIPAVITKASEQVFSISSQVTFLLMTSRRRWVPASAAKVRPLLRTLVVFSIRLWEKLSIRREGSERLTCSLGAHSFRSSSSSSSWSWSEVDRLDRLSSS